MGEATLTLRSKLRPANLDHPRALTLRTEQTRYHISTMALPASHCDRPVVDCDHISGDLTSLCYHSRVPLLARLVGETARVNSALE